MVKIKICGMMSFEDIEAVNELRPDFAGFIFSPSKIGRASCRERVFRAV